MSSHDFSCVIAYLPPRLAAKVKAEAAKIGTWSLAEDGREDQPHCTVLYGLHADSPSEVIELFKDEPPIELMLGKTSLFQNDDADVVKHEVTSRDLHRLNKKLRTLDHTNTHPDYIPHITGAYVKPGLGKKWAGRDALAGEKAVIDHVVFSSKNGTKTKIPLKVHYRYRHKERPA